jgi:hypothetical protein
VARPFAIPGRTRSWSASEDADVLAMSNDAFMRKHTDRSIAATNSRRRVLRRRGQSWVADRPRTTVPITPDPTVFMSDKKIGEFNWRDANKVMQEMIDLKSRASFSQDEANIAIDADGPIALLCLSDAHIGSWATDHELLERVTDEILNTPNLYVALLGDMEQMAIKASHGVLAMSDNLLPPELQHRYIESWLTDIEHRVLFSTWDNHAVMREEAASGYSRYADIMKRKVIWHSGIGHPNVGVGDQVYKLAVSHRFRLRTFLNPVHGGMQYIRHEAPDREISIAGDSHVAGITHWTLGSEEKLSVNCGSYQLNSGYGKRFFSLTTHPMMPVVVLSPSQHRFIGLPSVADWITLKGNVN